MDPDAYLYLFVELLVIHTLQVYMYTKLLPVAQIKTTLKYLKKG